MKASHVICALSLVVLFVVGWMLWPQHPAAPLTMPPDGFSVTTDPSQDFKVPDLLATPELPPVPLLPPLSLTPTHLTAAPGARQDLPPLPSNVPEEKPYAAPLPPNPHAFPPWPERVPHRESQLERGLYRPPMKLDN